ncbi:hypothetical protein C2E20_5946, partial [Micractinium conductrix]
VPAAGRHVKNLVRADVQMLRQQELQAQACLYAIGAYNSCLGEAETRAADAQEDANAASAQADQERRQLVEEKMNYMKQASAGVVRKRGGEEALSRYENQVEDLTAELAAAQQALQRAQQQTTPSRGSPNVSPRAGSAQQQLFGSPSRLGQLHRRAGSTAGTQADCAAAGISGGSGGAHAQEDRRATVACVHRSAGAEHEAAAAGAVQAALANKQRKVAHAVLLDPRASIVMEQQQQQHDDLIKAVPAPSGTPATGAAAQQAAATPRASPLPDASALEQLQVKVDRQAAGSEEQQQGQKVPAGVEEPQQQDGWVEEEQQQDGWVEEQQGDGEGVGTPLESPEVSCLLVGGSSGDGVSGVSGVSEPAQPAAVEADGGAEQQAVPVAGSPKAQPAPTQPLAAQLSPAPVPAADDQAGGWEAGSEAMEVIPDGQPWQRHVLLRGGGITVERYLSRRMLRPGRCHFCCRKAPDPACCHPEPAFGDLELCRGCYDGLEPDTWRSEETWPIIAEDPGLPYCLLCGGSACGAGNTDELLYCDACSICGFCTGCVWRFTGGDLQAAANERWECPLCRPAPKLCLAHIDPAEGQEEEEEEGEGAGQGRRRCKASGGGSGPSGGRSGASRGGGSEGAPADGGGGAATGLRRSTRQRRGAVRRRCESGRVQPSVLFYEAQH